MEEEGDVTETEVGIVVKSPVSSSLDFQIYDQMNAGAWNHYITLNRLEITCIRINQAGSFDTCEL